jgi:putative transposase
MTRERNSGNLDPRTVEPGTAKPGPVEPGTVEPGTVELQLDVGVRQKPGWYSGAYLPHLDAENLIQHVTFHLADSLPRSALRQLELSIEEMPENERKQQRREKYETFLDAGNGSCVLREPEAAEIVQDALFRFDGERYRLVAWVIMPNHVHVLLEVLPGFLLARVVQSWKSFTARRINAWLEDARRRAGARGSQEDAGRLGGVRGSQEEEGRGAGVRRFREEEGRRAGAGRSQDGGTGGLWQRDYWDRFIRDGGHLLAAIRYIEGNPVKAGLVEREEDWPWGSASARLKGQRRAGARRSQRATDV